jgi:Ran GTPase-activating protein (RanGAP) involved in mRNA processing and transport
MGSQGFTHLSVGLRANKSISTLSLARNNLGVKSGGTLEALLRANSSITCLDLSSNGLQDLGVSQLASGIAATLVYNTSLRHLNLRDNAIRVEGALELGCAMKMDTVKITSLDISLNPLGSLGVSHLVDPIFLGRPMVTFKASDCQIGMEGIIKVAEAVGVSTSLSALSLSNTRKQIAGGQKFANEIDDIAASILAEAGTNSAKYFLEWLYTVNTLVR